MRISRAVWLALGAALLSAAGIAGYLAAAPRPAFHPAAACETCHLGGKPESPEQAHLLIANQEKLCVRCHPKALQVSHPSGFAPREKLPAEYPLDWKGDLTCSSCHEVHGAAPGLMRGNKRRRDLCLACHDGKFFERMKDRGNSVMVSGHLAIEDAPQSMLDTYSIQCLDCHDSKGDSPSIDSRRILRHGTGNANHPIAVSYVEAANGGGYRPIDQLPKRILLPNGRISCVSCHDGYNGNHGKLVAVTAGSSLCFECHDL